MRPTVHTIVIGIDPGASGGIAVLYLFGKFHTDSVVTLPIPDSDLQICSFLRTLQEQKEKDTIPEIVAWIEKVHAMPQQGVTSSFNFGVNYGKLLMALAAFQIPYQMVTPQAWQKRLQIPSRNTQLETKLDFKNRLRLEAQRRFPNLAIWQGTKGSQLAVADALLIASYGVTERSAHG